MEYLNLNLDKNLTPNSDTTISSQKALKSYIDAKRINLDFLQAIAPSEFSIGDKWLNTTNKKLYTATSSSTWDSGVSLTDGQIYSFENLLYHYDGTNILIYSTESITEQNNRNEIKSWFGTQNEYDALSDYDANTNYYIVDNASVISTLLATQQEFNNSVQDKAATPYQINQKFGNYLPLAGGNLDAGAVLRLTNSNNGTVTLAYNTSNYLTVSSNLSVNGTISTNSLIAISGNIYNGSTSGPTVIWNNTFATSSSAGIVKPDNITTSVDANGIISSISANSSIISLNFLQETTPTIYDTGYKWLNNSNYKLYIATSNSTWDSGQNIEQDQIFDFNNLLYHYNGSTLNDLSSLSNIILNLQTAVTNLQGEVSKMLGRIDYNNANKVSFEVRGNNSGFLQTYTVPSDGYIFITAYNEASGTNTMYINDVAIISPKAEVTMILGNSIPVSKNDVIKCQSSVQTNMKVNGIFVPQKS